MLSWVEKKVEPSQANDWVGPGRGEARAKSS